MTWQSLKDHLFEVIAGAAVLGVGTATVTNVVSNGQQEVKIERLEKIEPKLDELRSMQTETLDRLARIEGKLEPAP